jgi:hypothetical protein
VGLFADAKVVTFYTKRGFTPLAANSLELYIPKGSIAQILAEFPQASF